MTLESLVLLFIPVRAMSLCCPACSLCGELDQLKGGEDTARRTMYAAPMKRTRRGCRNACKFRTSFLNSSASTADFQLYMLVAVGV
eukprot:3482179-Amphidinium_carterae.3